VAAGASICAFDPIAQEAAARDLTDLGASVEYASGACEAVAGADAVVIMTEWNEFRNLDLGALRSLVASPLLIDARNILEPERARAAGFRYLCTGREQAVEPFSLDSATTLDSQMVSVGSDLYVVERRNTADGALKSAIEA
jgi:hypothetical protein